MPDTIEASTPSTARKIQQIVRTVRAEERRLRARYPLLRFQDALGLLILLVSMTGMIASGWLYFDGAISIWVCIPLSAWFASLSHELEHDLIHRQYFKKQPKMQNAMMLIVWIMRPNTVSPWYRRRMHIHHHRHSGTQQDLEERLVGNGIRYGLTRCLVMFDNFLGLFWRQHILRREVRGFSLRRVLLSSFPLATAYYGIWYCFLLFHLVDAVGGFHYPLWFLQTVDAVNLIVVVLIAPNVLRSGCLNFVTSAMHYYGNVGNLIEQTQILKPWFLLPLNLFCFNFGSTHGIHHFVIGQPFYLRQMVAPVAHRVMRENGVRYNDLQTFRRANRL